MKHESMSNTFELEEHKLSEIIKSSIKHSEEHRDTEDFISPSKTVTHNFHKKLPHRQNLQSNLYPQSGGNSMKNMWSSRQETSQHIQNLFESCQNTQSRGILLKSGSYNQSGQTSFNTSLAKNLKREISRQSRKASFGSALKHKSKGKLFSMRKQAKIKQQASAKQRQKRLDSRHRVPQLAESNVLPAPEHTNQMLRHQTKFHIAKAKLSKEDFSLPEYKLSNLFINQKKASSKKSLLENKIAMKAKLTRNEQPTNNLMDSRKQHSIFEETQAKFELNLSSTRAANLLQKIVSKEKSPLSSQRIQVGLKKSKHSIPGKSQHKQFKIKRTRTREYCDNSNSKLGIKFFKKSGNYSRNESLDLSDSVGFKSRGAKGFKANKENGQKNMSRFYYKKSLKKHLYNQESLENKTYQSIYVYKDEPKPPVKKLTFDKPQKPLKMRKLQSGILTNRSRSHLNNSQSKMLTSRNFSRKRGLEEQTDLRQSSMSSNNSLYNNPGFVSVTKKIEQGKLFPYNYSEKKVIVRKTSVGEKEQMRAEGQLTTSQFSKLYKQELDSSSSVRRKQKKAFQENQYRLEFCPKNPSIRRHRKHHSSQLEEYLGTKDPNTSHIRQNTLMGYSTEYDFHKQRHKTSSRKDPSKKYHTNKQRTLQTSQVKKFPGQKYSTQTSVKKHSTKKLSTKKNSTKKSAKLKITDSYIKKSKWAKKSNSKTQYEKWKSSKRNGREGKHVRKHSEQLFSTLRDNSFLKQSGHSRHKLNDNMKSRKKLSIEISKNSLAYPGAQYMGISNNEQFATARNRQARPLYINPSISNRNLCFSSNKKNSRNFNF